MNIEGMLATMQQVAAMLDAKCDIKTISHQCRGCSDSIGISVVNDIQVGCRGTYIV